MSLLPLYLSVPQLCSPLPHWLSYLVLFPRFWRFSCPAPCLCKIKCSLSLPASHHQRWFLQEGNISGLEQTEEHEGKQGKKMKHYLMHVFSFSSNRWRLIGLLINIRGTDYCPIKNLQIWWDKDQDLITSYCSKQRHYVSPKGTHPHSDPVSNLIRGGDLSYPNRHVLHI